MNNRSSYEQLLEVESFFGEPYGTSCDDVVSPPVTLSDQPDAGVAFKEVIVTSPEGRVTLEYRSGESSQTVA